MKLKDWGLGHLDVTQWELSKLELPKLGFAAFRRRIIFRTAFALLILITLGLALTLLQEEKQRSIRLFSEGTKKTLAEVVAKLRHPSGQLALLNPNALGLIGAPNAAPAASPASLSKNYVRPLVLPYTGLDFADQGKAQQAVETVGCQMQYPDSSSLCVAVGNSARSGGFVYVVGSFPSPNLVAREIGEIDLSKVHRARLSLEVDGQVTRWVAPFELATDLAISDGRPAAIRGRLAGFLEGEGALPGADPQALERKSRPVKEFRAWVWQDAECLAPEAAESSCAKRTFFSIRLPVEAYRDAIFLDPRAPWPPKAFEKTGVRLEMFGPASERAIFDSAKPGATPPFSWSELAASLSAGETLSVRRIGKDVVSFTPILRLKGAEEPGVQPAWWISQLIARLPLGPGAKSSAVQEAINTYVGRYEVSLEGDVRAVERNLAATVTRLSWFIGAMLAAIVLAWFIIEMGLIRRISLLTKRAATLSHSVNVNTALVGELEVADLRGKDELGILAGGLADLLQRVKTDVKREQIRAEQERDMWHAVGHEIMSPLQSLMVLHGKESDSSHRYVKRMQQAVKVLYGSASPSEAIEASHLQMAGLDLVAFLQHVAANAHYAGIEAVEFKTELTQVQVNGDEYSLEDVMTHLLSNANRLRLPNTVIEIVLSASANEALITVFNQGPQIVPEALEQIFAYGVSSSDASNEHRGQGLFVAKTYVAKMQGSIKARNIDALLDHGAMRAGVAFDIRIPKIIETVSGRF